MSNHLKHSEQLSNMPAPLVETLTILGILWAVLLLGVCIYQYRVQQKKKLNKGKKIRPRRRPR